MWKYVNISDFLEERKDRINPDIANNSWLKRIEKINFSWNIFISDSKKTKTNMILVKTNDLIISWINVEKWALSVYQWNEDVLATIHNSSYIYDKKKINIEYLRYFLKSPRFKEIIIEQTWTWIKTEIKAKKFLKLKVYLPSLSEQLELLSKIHNIENNVIEQEDISMKNCNYVKLLKQSILQEAIEWTLTKSWREKNKSIEPASILLEKIKVEKEELVKQKKLKKQKELNPIWKNEIPFEIPNNNILCRLWEVIQVNPRNKLDDNIDTTFIPMKLIKDWFVNEHISENRKWKEIKTGFTHFKEKDIVFAKITPCFQNRKSAVMKNLINWYWAWTTELIVLRSFKETILPELLLYFVKSKSFIDLWVSTYTWTAWQQRVDREKLLNMPFLLPPLDEQKEIVKKVEELMVLCDKLEKQTLETKEDSENLMKAVLGEGFNK